MPFPIPRVFAFVVLLCTPLAAWADDKAAAVSSSALHRLDPQTAAGLQALLKYSKEPLPLVSGHRGGGAQQGYPENCIATFEHTLRHTYALLEVDPRYTKDGEIVLHHDATLNRTTTGQGKVIDFTLAELKQLRLKDAEGNPTDYQIPTLGEALEWARGKAVLVLDQKDVPVVARVKAIEQHKAEGFAMIIVNSFGDAEACYKANPNIVMEVLFGSREKVADFEKRGIPWANVVAFVGHTPPEDIAFYEAIHAHGACCMIGTSRNLDRKFIKRDAKDISDLEPAYRAFLARGADLIETDIPAPLGPMLYRKTPIPADKRAYFHPPVAAPSDDKPSR